MKIKWLFLASCFLCFCDKINNVFSVAFEAGNSADTMSDLKSVYESQNQFALDLYSKLADGSSDNIFFSPISIATALAMVLFGARENTEKQIVSTLHFHQDKSLIKKGFSELMSEYEKDVEEYTLKSSNKAYVSHKLNLLKDFEDILKNDFHSLAKLVNFDQAEEVRKEINQAVEQDTNNKIKDLIPPGVLDPLTRLVLVNAVYFKGFWQEQFNKNNTRDGKFWVAPGHPITVKMMHQEGKKFKLGRSESMDCTALSMDYKGGRISMVILLPNKVDGLAKLESSLTIEALKELKKSMHPGKVRVTMPKFKLEQTLDMIPILGKMGISDLFSEKDADLSGVSGAKDLFVSAVIHKSFVEVNEEGAEAAAATGAVVRLKRSLIVEEEEEFIVDRPFIFIIHSQNNAIHFFGRVASLGETMYRDFVSESTKEEL